MKSVLIDSEVKTCLWLVSAVVIVEFGLLTTNYLSYEWRLQLSRADHLTIGALFFPFYMLHVYGASWLSRQILSQLTRTLIVALFTALDLIFLLGGTLGVLVTFSLTDQDMSSILCFVFVLKTAPLYAESWSCQPDLLIKTPKLLLLLIVKELVYFGLFTLVMTWVSSDADTHIIYVFVFLLGRSVLLRLRLLLLEANLSMSKNWLHLL